MKQVVRALGVLLVASLAVQVSAQLLAPAMPLLVVLFALVALLVFVISGPGGFRK